MTLTLRSRFWRWFGCVPVNFSKKRAEYLLDCLKEGKPIEPGSDELWSHSDMLQIAGAMIFAAGTHPSPQDEPYLIADLMAAANLCEQLTEHVLDETYDADFEESVLALVRYDEKNIKVSFVRGAKGGE